MNSDPLKDEQLQRLLRLKRYEQPPEGYAEELLEKFQRRQRAEILQRGPLSLLRERLAGWMQSLRRPAVLWSAAAAYAAVLATLWLLPRPSQNGGTTILVGTVPEPAATIPVSTNSGAQTISAPPPEVPGKRRTSDQEQDPSPLIGPEERPEDDGKPRHDPRF